MNLGNLLTTLHPKWGPSAFCHLDPDLRPDALVGRDCLRDWRALFGQAGPAAGHLRRQGVGPGDLFLFFGYFRESNGWDAFVRNAPRLHVIHGWLQVDEVVTDPRAWVRKNPWAKQHPHTYGKHANPNMLFVAKKRLEFATRGRQVTTTLPGAGVFTRFDPRLVLTAPDQPKTSVWRLPASIRPDDACNRTISYLNKAHWKSDGDHRYVIMDPARATLWQEAVICGGQDVVDWARGLISINKAN
jgi:hypothetical protein